jgi:mono/diheme cytochrome c family protein
MMRTTLRAAAAAAALATLGCAGAASAADLARGRALYDARCGNCHNESVHNDNSRKATSIEAVRARVADFGARVDAKWTAAQIDDVTVYLNERYYRFPCPPALCPKPAQR